MLFRTRHFFLLLPLDVNLPLLPFLVLFVRHVSWAMCDAQDYYDAQFTLGEAGPPAYIVFTDVDYFQAFNDSDSRQRFTGVSNGLAQLQR